MKKRYHGAELQERFDRLQRDALETPSHQCMLCKRSDLRLSTTECIFGDLLMERETGQLPINGRFVLRMCTDCWKKVDTTSREDGVPMRWLR